MGRWMMVALGEESLNVGQAEMACIDRLIVAPGSKVPHHIETVPARILPRPKEKVIILHHHEIIFP